MRRFTCGVVLLALAMSAAASDLVIRTDGRKQRGKLKSCIGSRCQLDAQSIPRESIAWIGLEAKASFPPAVKNAYTDEVHLADGSVEVANIIGLSLGEIVTEKSNFVRSDVAWIHFVPPNKSNEPIIDDSGDEPAAPAPAPAPAPSPATPKPKQSKPNPQPQTQPKPVPKPQTKPSSYKSGVMKPCPADNPMGGLVVFNANYNRGRAGCFETVHTVLRFPLVRFWHSAASTPWARQVAIDFNESKIDWEVSTTGCSGTTPNGEEVCQEPAMHQSGTWVRTPADTTLPVIRFSAVKPRLDATSLPREIAAPFTVPFDCKGPRSSGHSSHTEGLGGFSVDELTSVACTNNEGFVFCVPPPGECVLPTSLPNEECLTHADRHAVFPFSGDASWHSTNANEELVDTKIHWDICCGCAAKPAPPDVIPRTPEKDDCTEELAKLEGRKKGLEDAAEIDRKDLANKQYLRDKAFKEAFGEGLFEFSNALLGLASKAGEGALSKILGLVSAVISNTTDPNDLTTLAVAVEAGASPVSFQPAIQHAIEEASHAAETYLAQHPGDLAGAQSVYLAGLKEVGESIEQTQKGLEGVAIALAVIDFAKATHGFGDKLSEYFETENEFNEAGEHLENIEDQIKDLDAEIQKLLADCPEAGQPESGAHLIREQGPFRLISNAKPARATATSAKPDPAAMDKLTKLQGMVDRTNQRIVQSVVPMLLPFLSHQWRNVRREFLVAAVKAVEPDLRAVVNELQQEVALGHEIEQSMQATSQSGQHASKEDPRSDDRPNGTPLLGPSIAKR